MWGRFDRRARVWKVTTALPVHTEGKNNSRVGVRRAWRRALELHRMISPPSSRPHSPCASHSDNADNRSFLLRGYALHMLLAARPAYVISPTAALGGRAARGGAPPKSLAPAVSISARSSIGGYQHLPFPAHSGAISALTAPRGQRAMASDQASGGKPAFCKPALRLDHSALAPHRLIQLPSPRSMVLCVSWRWSDLTEKI